MQQPCCVYTTWLLFAVGAVGFCFVFAAVVGFCFAFAAVVVGFALLFLRFSYDFCCVPGRCILNLLFAFSRMIFPALMHLKFAILALRDAFRRWKSSLPEVSIKSG